MYKLYDYIGATVDADTPQKYGALADGVHDCSSAIAQLITANVGGTIYFPEGVYGISEPIKTYPSYSKGVNIILHPSAKIIALSSVNYLLDIGSLSETGGTGRGKKVVQGGIFDANNGNVTNAAVRINAQNIDFSGATILTTGCNGVEVGESGVSKSTDAYLHNLFIMHGNVRNTDSGIILYANDNNVSSCRVYYYGVNLNSFGGSELFTDVHTLANGQGGADQVTLLTSSDVYLTNCYGDSEDTFIRTRSGTSPRIHLNNCIYYSYKTNDVVLFDISNTAKIKINGLDLTAKNASYIGVKMPYSSFKDVLNPLCFDVEGLWINNPQYIRNGDPIKGLQTNGKDPFFLPTSMTNGTWYKVGSIAVNDTVSHVIRLITSGGKTEIPLSVRCSSGGTITVNVASGKVSTTDTGSYQIGVTLANSGFDSSTDYPIVDVYVKRSSGSSRTIYAFNMESNYMARVSPDAEGVALSSASVTPDKTATINCDTGTLAVA